MSSSVRRLRGLYAITDGPRDDLLAVCTAAIDGGAALLQYRDKSADTVRRRDEATRLSALCAQRDVVFIVNDDVELAAACGAGVHLGEHDGDIAAARARLGARALIGVSCYDSLERARAMADAGADYLAFGAFFASPTKPAARRATVDLLRDAQSLGRPLVAIGGITPDNARALVDAGADCISAISALFGAADVRDTARAFARLFDSARA